MSLQRIGATELLYRARGDIRGSTLEIGVGGNPYRALTTGATTIDIDPAVSPDVFADAHSLPFRDGAFDTVVASQVFEHLHSPARAASEAARVLRPGGRLLVAVPFMYWLHAIPHDYFRFTEYGLGSLFEPHFEDVDVTAYGGRLAVAYDVLSSVVPASTRARKGAQLVRHRIAPPRVRRHPFIASQLLRARSRGTMPCGYFVRAVKPV